MDLSGTQLGKYRVLSEIGRGGMGAVHRGFDPALNRSVAIKVLAPHLTWEQHSVDRFLREARTVANLSHPHIVNIYDVGEKEGIYYLVMDLVPGEPLSAIISREGPLPPGRAVSILVQVAGALDYAHRRGIIHRDIKPGNILVGPGDQVKLTDFGIAQMAEGTRLTATGMTLGTPEYMSPEQARGESATAQSDLYALGVVLYEMLTSRVPFRAETPLAVLHAQGYDPPPSPRDLNPALSVTVEQVVLQSLAKDPKARYGSAADLYAAFHAAVADGQGHATRGAGLVTVQQTLPWQAFLFGGAGLLAVVAVVVVVVLVVLPNDGLFVATAEPVDTLAPVSATDGTATIEPVSTEPLSPIPELQLPTLPTNSPTPTPTPTTTSTLTTTSSPTSTPAPTSTPTSTSTPTLTMTPTHIPSPEPATRDKIAFTSSKTGNNQVYIMNLDGTGVQQLTQRGTNGGPAWSPDAEWLAFTSTQDGNGEIYVMRADGSDARNVTSSPGSNEKEPAWSPDGRRLAFVSDRAGNDDIFVVSVQGGEWTRLTTAPEKDCMPDWSVIGKIAFWSDRPDTYNAKNDPEIYVMNADGSDQQNISRSITADYNPRWSPDGSRIVFKSHVKPTMDLFVMNADGSGRTRLTDEFVYLYAADWSPDGRYLVFAMETDCPADQRKDCNLEIYTMRADGGPLTRLTYEPGDDIGPVWSPK